MPTPKHRRLLYLDFVRGSAALVMLQGHVFHSFLKNDLRTGGVYVFSQFVGGMPPAVFLFLTGVTLAFLMDGRERQGLPVGARIWAATRRSGYLLGIAALFRLQLWLFGWPFSPWQELFKVDILNCMGFGVALMSFMAVFRTSQRVRICAVLGLAIAAASPLVSQLNWSGVPPVVAHYIAPDLNHFGFFPWASYLVFGMSAGSLIRVLRDEDMDRTRRPKLCHVLNILFLSPGQRRISCPATWLKRVSGREKVSSRRGRSHRRGASLIAILRRTEGTIARRSKPPGLAPDRGAPRHREL